MASFAKEDEEPGRLHGFELGEISTPTGVSSQHPVKRDGHGDLRIVLLGKTGSGKSATGNTILGREAFKSESSPVSVTSQSEKQSGDVNGMKIDVIDTPGFFDPTTSQEKMKMEIENAIKMSVPGPHAFLLVISLGRFTEEEQNAVKWIQENFGEEASKYTMVLFTGEDQLNGKSVEDFLEPCVSLQELIKCCYKRYHCLNNVNRDDHSQVITLLEKIEQMLEENGGEPYTSDMGQRAESKLTRSNSQQGKPEGWRSVCCPCLR